MNNISATDKLREGQKILNEAGGDPYRLGAALTMLHGALEDRLRDLLASRLPAMSTEIHDAGRFKWNQILEYAQTYLGLSRSDREFIAGANRHRNDSAHGNGVFTWNRAGLMQYEELIRRIWETGSRSGRVIPPAGQQAAAQPVNWEPASQPGRAAPRPQSYHPGKPWYRSTAFYWLLFLFFLPVWVIMILTDRRQGCLIKSVALILAGAYAAGLYLLWNMLPLTDLLNNPVALAPTQSATGTAVPRKQPTQTRGPQSTQTQQQMQASNTAPGCQVQWVEMQDDRLNNKSRAMAWTEIISQQVSGSGMDAKQFYQQVVEHNPSLKADGYVFQQGKKYLLPACR